jgi:formiminotetrahydrofolate cyclodeaminase
MKLADKSLTALLADIRSSAPTPGGGSASAVAGAIGASLLAMVAALPKPRASSETEIHDLKRAGESATSLARELEALVDRDSEAYELVVSANRMPMAPGD